MGEVARLEVRYGFYLLGGVCFGLGLSHLALDGNGIGSVLEGILICGLSTVALYTGSTVSGLDIPREGEWRAVKLSIGIALSFSLLAFAVWLTWFLQDEHIELSFLLSFAAALGAAVGSRASLYAVRYEHQLEQARELTQLLRINQRVLRHNLRNELTIALGNLDGIESETDRAEIARRARIAREHLRSLNETSDRAQRLVSIWENNETHEVDLTALVTEQVEAFRAEHPDATITTDLPEECRVIAHLNLPLAIAEALTNVVEHNPPDVSISVTVTEHEDGTATATIADTGAGIPAMEQAAFDFDSPEETALTHSQGIGLWLIYWVVHASDGTMEINADEPSGTRLRLTLPMA